MGERQISVVLDKKTRARLVAEASKKEMTISQITRKYILEGLSITDEVVFAVNRDLLEEILITIYGVEELVVRGFLDPAVSPKADEMTRLAILDSVDSNARRKAKKLIGRVRR